MGIRGLNSYIQRQRIPGGIRTLTESEILTEIKAFRSSGQTPTIVINVWAFCNYFEENAVHVLFGGRLNKIRGEFEAFLMFLKSAGARLIFLFKKSGLRDEQDWTREHGKECKQGIEFLEQIKGMTTVEAYDRLCNSFNRTQPLNSIVHTVLCQVAANYGEFQGTDLFLIKETAGHVELANRENAFALIGLDTYFLCFEGTWRFWSPRNFNRKDLKFQEYNKETILKHLQLNYEQMQFLAVLSGKLKANDENLEIIDKHFKGIAQAHKLKNTMDYVRTLRLPIDQAGIEATVELIFGSVDPSMVQEFTIALKSFTGVCGDDKNRFPDEEVAKLIVNKPLCLAERILNQRTIECYSPFLDVSASDMKSLKDLVLPWVRRTMGLLLKHVDGPKNRRFISKADGLLWDAIEVEPETPRFEVPLLNLLVVGDMTHQVKIQILHFLIHGVIDQNVLNDIPVCYMIHLIILVHLVKNDSMKPFEARAMMQAIVDEELMRIPVNFVLPHELNMRAFRLSSLFAALYFKLLCCMTSVGLKDFAADIKLDNAHFQNHVNEFLKHGDDQIEDSSGITEQLLKIINR